MSEPNLDKEQIELLRELAKAHQSLSREERQDFVYNEALTRIGGALPLAKIHEAFQTGSVLFKGQQWFSAADIPKNYDKDIVVHPGLPDGDIEVLQHDIDTLIFHDLIRSRDKSHFYMTPKGLGYNSIPISIEESSKILQGQPMKKLIFISHKETDRAIAAKLVDFVLAALEVKDDEVLCTSVPGHQLQFGPSIQEQLRDNLKTSTALIAVLTPESVQATWVLFEIGAAWAMSKIVVPILAPGLQFKDLPGPLVNCPGVLVSDPNASSRLMDAVTQIASTISVQQKTGGKVTAKLDEFLNLFRSLQLTDIPKSVPPAPAGNSLDTSRKESIRSALRTEIDHNLSLLQTYKEKIYKLTQASGSMPPKPLFRFTELSIPIWSRTVWTSQGSQIGDFLEKDEFQKILAFYSGLDDFQGIKSARQECEAKEKELAQRRAEIIKRNLADSSMSAGLDEAVKEIRQKSAHLQIELSNIFKKTLGLGNPIK